jgi:hypothetical protein
MKTFESVSSLVIWPERREGLAMLTSSTFLVQVGDAVRTKGTAVGHDSIYLGPTTWDWSSMTGQILHRDPSRFDHRISCVPINGAVQVV